MAETIKSTFTDLGKDLKVDNSLIKRIMQFERDYINSDEAITSFLGSNLLGVHPIRFKDTDRSYWFDDVVEIDDYLLKERINELESINPKFKVSSDVFNLSCLWLVHVIATQGKLSDKERERGMITVLMILHYRFISSLMSHYFRYPADESVAIATYAALSKKFALKQLGNWTALFKARAEDIIGRRSIHYETYRRFDDDQDIIRMINDIQNRIREVVKKMVAVFFRIREEDARIGRTSISGIDLDGEMSVMDQVKNRPEYIRYAKSIIGDSRVFIKDELVEVVISAMHTISERYFLDTLKYVSNNYQHRGEKKTDKLIDETLLHAFDVIGDDSNYSRAFDLASLLSKLRALYMASRSSDPQVMEMREIGEEFAKKATRTNNQSVLASVRTGLLLYLILRTLSKKFYQ